MLLELCRTCQTAPDLGAQKIAFHCSSRKGADKGESICFPHQETRLLPQDESMISRGQTESPAVFSGDWVGPLAPRRLSSDKVSRTGHVYYWRISSCNQRQISDAPEERARLKPFGRNRTRILRALLVQVIPLDHRGGLMMLREN